MLSLRTVALGLFLLVGASSLCAAEEYSALVSFDAEKRVVTLTIAEASYPLSDPVEVEVLKWFAPRRITVDGVVKDGRFVFRQIVSPRLDSTLQGVAFKERGEPKIRLGDETFSVTGPGLRSIAIGIRAGARSVAFEAYVLRTSEGAPDTIVVKRVQAKTKVAMFLKGRVEAGATVWILGDAWWGLKAKVLGPGGTRANASWGDLAIGEPAEQPPATQGTGLSGSLDEASGRGE